jgi:hypothetical protein
MLSGIGMGCYEPNSATFHSFFSRIFLLLDIGLLVQKRVLTKIRNKNVLSLGKHPEASAPVTHGDR